MSDTLAAANPGEDSGTTGPAADGKAAWTERAVAPVIGKHPERRERFESTSGVEVDRVYAPEDVAELDYARDLGWPGEYPFTRGIQPTMYRGRFWTMRQYAG
ncbi:MAG TPA: methylmalonyl-CoA mutase family protein, partial [Candidatus Limnocylindria bacterium]|nr:methylmalonyl-CoA mutase family protein [Candidatus Limnocylindria bacterium]